MIERESPIPLYYQLKELLSGRISSGEWQPGDMLPTEEQLQEQFGLSRTTVRQALKELELEGRIARYRGRGTIVAKPKISHSAEPHFSLTDVLLQQGVQPGWQVLSAEWMPAPEDVAKRLGLEAETPVYRLRRLRLANEEAIGYHVAYAAPAAATAIDKNRLEQGGSLDYLRGDDSLTESYSNRIIEAIPATHEVAELLDVDEGSPILLINRRVIGSTGTPLEILRAMYRGDRLQYRVWQGPEYVDGSSGDGRGV